MPLGIPQLSNDSDVMVNTVTGTVGRQPVGGVRGWVQNNTRPTTVRKYIGQASFRSVGEAEPEPTLALDYEKTDSGQIMFWDAFDANTTIFLTVLENGTDGREWPVKVAGMSDHADADGMVELDVTFAVQGAPLTIGTGP
jgi:hypothetical protein